MEAALLSACVSGEEAGWRRFTETYGGLIRATVRTACRRWKAPEAEIEDLESHVYEKLVEDRYRRLRMWRQESAFPTYLVQIVKRLAIDHFKYVARRTDGLGFRDDQADLAMTPSLPEDFGTAEELDRMRRAIDALPDRQAKVMKLRLEGKSLREVASILALPQGTVFSDNARALETLRKALYPDPDDGRTPHP